MATAGDSWGLTLPEYPPELTPGSCWRLPLGARDIHKTAGSLMRGTARRAWPTIRWGMRQGISPAHV